MISKRIFSIALTWLAAMSMHAGTYTFKIVHPEEGAKLKLTWCASNEIMDVDVVNGVVTVKKMVSLHSTYRYVMVNLSVVIYIWSLIKI